MFRSLFISKFQIYFFFGVSMEEQSFFLFKSKSKLVVCLVLISLVLIHRKSFFFQYNHLFLYFNLFYFMFLGA